MTKIITLSNHKGGVGKTTSTLNLGAGIANRGKRVLLVDFDPQANLSQSLAVHGSERTIYGALRGQYKAEPLPIYKGLDLIPSTLDLSGAEIELSSEAGREFILRELLEPFRGRYDFILIDSPPSLGLLAINALTASNSVLVPLQAHYLALQGLSKLLEVIDKIRGRLNNGLEIGGVFITQYDGRKVLSRNVADTLAGHFGAKLFTTKIRDNIALAEAPVKGLDIFRYQPNSNGAEDYAKLTGEVLKRLK